MRSLIISASFDLIGFADIESRNLKQNGFQTNCLRRKTTKDSLCSQGILSMMKGISFLFFFFIICSSESAVYSEKSNNHINKHSSPSKRFKESTIIATSLTSLPRELPQSPFKSPSDQPPYKLNKQQSVYLFLSSLFVTCLIVADVVGVKIFELKLPFPILGKFTCSLFLSSYLYHNLFITVMF